MGVQVRDDDFEHMLESTVWGNHKALVAPVDPSEVERTRFIASSMSSKRGQPAPRVLFLMESWTHTVYITCPSKVTQLTHAYITAAVLHTPAWALGPVLAHERCPCFSSHGAPTLDFFLVRTGVCSGSCLPAGSGSRSRASRWRQRLLHPFICSPDITVNLLGNGIFLAFDI